MGTPYTQHSSLPFSPAIGARLVKADTSEHLKPRSQYGEDAVQLAIAGKWDEAAKLNRFIIESFGADEETQNRLGKALSELGKLKEAKASYEAALKLNPMNSIAKKNAARINALLHQKEGLKVGGTRVDLNLFVEEMGKTVITTVDSPPKVDICSKVAAGDVAELKIEDDGIVAETSRGVRLGLLEAKLARRLTKFMRGGNRYQAGVTSCDGNTVKLIVRETYQDPHFAGKPSFPMRRKREVEFRPYAKESLLARDSKVFAGDEEEEETLAEAPASDDLEEGMHAVEDEGEAVDFSEDADADGEDEDEDEN
ncbi:MAG: tetratricopeptide repeat protein [Chloroflexi bacterium]|nr:MAG: tetratricopeptide repeat protein [Chloroflexota bacterium]TMF31340.1 MAG: tetratricopeptide repeat protein [Chloroflexota bacterium]